MGLGTTKEEYAQLFAETLEREWPILHAWHWIDNHPRRFPNGSVAVSPTYRIAVRSKVLYELFKQFKFEDFHWKVPALARYNVDVRRGFLRGLFDAEGCVTGLDSTRKVRIVLTSKHRSNLDQVPSLLQSFGIDSAVYGYQRIAQLMILRHRSILAYANNIGFRLRDKQQKLVDAVALINGSSKN